MYLRLAWTQYNALDRSCLQELSLDLLHPARLQTEVQIFRELSGKTALERSFYLSLLNFEILLCPGYPNVFILSQTSQ